MFNRRFLDPLFFAFCMGIDGLIWLSTWFFHSTPDLVIIMVPSFAAMTLIALGRSLLHLEAKSFWGVLAFVTAVFLLMTMATETLMAGVLTEKLAFSASIWFMATAFVSSIVALFLALVGAIPASGPGRKPGNKPASETASETSSETSSGPQAQNNGSAPELEVTEIVSGLETDPAGVDTERGFPNENEQKVSDE